MEENHANLLDDQVDSQLARKYDSSQQKREMEQVFAQCERTLIDVSNVELQPVDDAADPVRMVDDINWEDDVTIAEGGGQKKPDDRSILNSIFNKRSSLAAEVGSPKVVARKSGPLVSSHFQDRGPFFGLPLKVKHLLKNYRGIENMYGEWRMV